MKQEITDILLGNEVINDLAMLSALATALDAKVVFEMERIEDAA
jgi:hypothetical protein